MPSDDQQAPIIITRESGLRFGAQVRSHRVFVDQPRGNGGDDSAPMPTELLGAALGTCIAFYVHQFCVARGISSEGMRVEVTSESARNPSRASGFDVRVVAPAGFPETYVELLERVARNCPVHNTLALGAHVDVVIDTPVQATV